MKKTHGSYVLCNVPIPTAKGRIAPACSACCTKRSCMACGPTFESVGGKILSRNQGCSHPTWIKQSNEQAIPGIPRLNHGYWHRQDHPEGEPIQSTISLSDFWPLIWIKWFGVPRNIQDPYINRSDRSDTAGIRNGYKWLVFGKEIPGRLRLATVQSWHTTFRDANLMTPSDPAEIVACSIMQRIFLTWCSEQCLGDGQKLLGRHLHRTSTEP